MSLLAFAYPEQHGGYSQQSSRMNTENLGNSPDNPASNVNQQNGTYSQQLGQNSQLSGSLQEEQPKRRGRGFASMDPQRVSEIASMGGKAAHAQGVAHEWSSEEARAAGRKGGQASRTGGSQGG